MLESGNDVGNSALGWTFVGVVNRDIKVPKGEAGLIFMRDYIRKHKRKKKNAEPPFTGGFVGFLSYEWEPYFVYVDEVMAFQRRGSPCLIFVADDPHIARSNMYDLAMTSPYMMGWSRVKTATKMYPRTAAPKSNISLSMYLQKIAQIKEYLAAGETYQVNFSQKFQTPYGGDAFELYKKVTAINPSPFQFFLETKDFAVISNSPERLMKLKGNIIETKPIKGTMPRGKNPKEDAVNIKKLLASAKERAELEMIVDLARNDIGKICRPGTVKVTELRAVEKYSHVIHTSATIRGKMQKGRDWLDALHALFPGGSVTGCPKKRTMEIIKKLEGEPRGVYCGSAGYIDLSGDCDFNIMIRTLWLDKKTHQLSFRSGGGIVVDSDPEKEYAETMHKSQALMSAVAS